MIEYIRGGDFDSPSDITAEALFLSNQRRNGLYCGKEI